MIPLQTSRLVWLFSAAALVTALGGCVSRGPDPERPNAPLQGLRFFSPFGMSQPNELQGNAPPSAGVFCLLSTARRCDEVFPEPARPCLLATERCPPDAQAQLIETRPLVQQR